MPLKRSSSFSGGETNLNINPSNLFAVKVKASWKDPVHKTSFANTGFLGTPVEFSSDPAMAGYNNLTSDNIFLDVDRLYMPCADGGCQGTMTFQKTYENNVIKITRNSIAGSGTNLYTGNVIIAYYIQKIGTYDFTYSLDVDFSSIDNCKNIATDDIVVDFNSVTIPEKTAESDVYFTKKYDSSNCKFTISRNAYNTSGTPSHNIDIILLKNI